MNKDPLFEGKFLDIFETQRNDVSFSHIHDRFHHEFNEWTLPLIWEEGVLFFVLREYQKITLVRVPKALAKNHLKSSLSLKKKCKITIL